MENIPEDVAGPDNNAEQGAQGDQEAVLPALPNPDAVQEQWWEYYVPISIDEVMQPGRLSQEKRLECIILGIKKNDNKLLSFYQRGKTQGDKTSIQATAAYDRLFLCGATRSVVGSCFVIITHSSQQSAAFLESFTGDQLVVGRTGYLLEPIYEGKTLTNKGFLPVLDVKEPFQASNIVQQEVPFSLQSLPEDTKFFFLSGVRVLCDRAYVVTADCTGVQCDRLYLGGNSKNCGCFKVNVKARPTFRCTLIVQEVNPDRDVFTVDHRSWSLTELLLVITNDSINAQYEKHNLRAFRQSVNQSFQFINQNGGWDVCGWARKGTVVDASDQRDGVTLRVSEEVGSDYVAPHIIKLVPHNNSNEVLLGIERRRYRAV
jgi:hypothetical protein